MDGCAATSVRARTKKASPQRNWSRPYAATGSGAKWVSPIHAVTNGVSESQKSRCRFAHNTRPLT